MSREIFAVKDNELREKERAMETSLFIYNLRSGVWFIGIPSWLFGISDRTLAALVDGYLSPLDIAQLFTAFFFFVCWLYLKPELNWNLVETTADYQLDINAEQLELFKNIVANRMLQLQEQHMIRQEYILPYPHLCQIYHLLNLKHLETIHGFSLNNLRIVSVNNCQPTYSGGLIEFQTMLDSPTNILRIWRKPNVNVNLTLLTPYTVELSIPVYNEKRIIVLFNVLPLSQNRHKFYIDIYTNLEWPKPILQVILHLASSLTLWEDLPYLRKLAQRNVERLFNSNNYSDREACTDANHDTMWLYKRFVDLYGSSKVPAQLPLSVPEVSTNVGLAH
jgi:hypothetical protein